MWGATCGSSDSRPELAAENYAEGITQRYSVPPSTFIMRHSQINVNMSLVKFFLEFLTCAKQNIDAISGEEYDTVCQLSALT